MLKINSSGERKFVVLWTVELISSLGSSVASFGLMIWLYQVHENPAYLGYLFFSYLGPQIYLSLFAGHIVDHFDRKKLLMFSDGAQTLITLAFFYCVWQLNENLPLPIILFFNFLSGIFAALQSLVFLSSVVQFVKRDDLLKYNGLMQVFRACPNIISPLVAVPLLSLLGISGLLLLDAITFLFTALSIIFIKFPIIEIESKKRFLWHHFFEGFKIIKANINLVRSLRFFTYINFTSGLSAGLITAFIIEKAGKDSMWVAYNSSLAAFGILLGGLYVVKQAKKLSSPFLVMSLAIVVAAISGRIVVSLINISWLVGGFLLFRNLLIPIMNACNDTIWQKSVLPENQGKVFGSRRFVAQSLYPVGLLVGAALSDWLRETSFGIYLQGGAPALFLICGLLELLSPLLLIPPRFFDTKRL